MTRALVAIPLVAVALIAGCGGDDDEDSTETVPVGSPANEEPLTRVAFIAQADAICERLKAEQEPVEVEAGATGVEADHAADLLEQAAQISQARFDEIRALPAPKADRAVLSQIFDLAYEGIALLRSAAQSFRYGQSSGVDALTTRGRQNADQLKSLARGYGFRVCGQDD